MPARHGCNGGGETRSAQDNGMSGCTAIPSVRPVPLCFPCYRSHGVVMLACIDLAAPIMGMMRTQAEAGETGWVSGGTNESR